MALAYDLNSEVKVLVSTAPVVATAVLVGAEIDTKGFGSCEFVVMTGVLGAGTSNPIIEQSPDDGAGSPTGVWTAVPIDQTLGGDGVLAGTLGLIIATDDGAIFRFGSIGKERFQRLTLPETTDWTSFIVSAICILSNPEKTPVDGQSPV